MTLRTAEPGPERVPVWGYEDLALFLGAVLPSLGLAGTALWVGRKLAPSAFHSEGLTALVFQVVFYLALLGALRIVLMVKYQVGLLHALSFTFDFKWPWMYLMAGPFLTVAVSAVGLALRAPAIDSPVEGIIEDRRALILVLLLGPIFEELVFRGFLFPLFARSLGAWPAIFATAIPFALLHGQQSEWAWQLLVPIGLAGVAFGWVRHKSGSTIASTLVHIGYNSTAVAVYLLQHA
jgi:membrane protease YdiL (CAAX protease family)